MSTLYQHGKCIDDGGFISGIVVKNTEKALCCDVHKIIGIN